jgi:hypothetical protein
MKNIIKYIPLLLLTVLSSCGKDNYDEPQATLTGRIVYNGNPVQVRGTGEAVRLYLYQDGWQLTNPITMYVTQDGSFSAKLFNGEYKLVTVSNNGPWVNVRDTTVFTIKGSHSLDLNVTPYFTVSDENVSLSGSTLTVSFNISQIVSTAQLEKVYLILSQTQFADEVNNIVRQEVTNVSVGSNTFSADLSGNTAVSSAKFIYGRIGVKTSGVGEAIWTPVKKLR